MERNQKFILFLIVVLSTLLLFQNCGPEMSSTFEKPSITEPQPFEDKPVIPDCQFNRRGLFEGERTTAYQSSSVPVGSQCIPQVRVCMGGVLTGSYQHSTCLPGAPDACVQNGSTISHGQSTTFYRSQSVDFGATCEAESRTCNNGILTGSFQYSECYANSPTDCQVGTVRFAHNREKLFFKSLTVPFGEECQSEYRKCHNGAVVNGSFTETTCGVSRPRDCLHGGEPIAHEKSKEFFKEAAVPFGQRCQKASLSCYNGVVSGDTSFAAKECEVLEAEDCKLFDGTPVKHESTVIAYEFAQVNFGDDCERYTKVLTCTNKVMPDSNRYKYSKCTVGDGAQCLLPDGNRVDHGSTTNLKKYRYIVSGETCDDTWNIEPVTCNNGELSGTARYLTCQNVQPNYTLATAGPGGGEFNINCSSSGARGIGIYGATGDSLDRIGLKCSLGSDTVAKGGSGGGAFSSSCPAGKFLAGIAGSESIIKNQFNVITSGYVKHIIPYCANADGSEGILLEPGYGNPVYVKYYQICPPGEVVYGFKGRSGGLVDRIQTACVKMTEAADIDCVGRWINLTCTSISGTGQWVANQKYFYVQPKGGNGTACTNIEGETRTSVYRNRDCQ